MLFFSIAVGAFLGWNADKIVRFIVKGGFKSAPFQNERKERSNKASHFKKL